MASERAQWSSRWGFILAATGSAVGLGNIWRFPYMTGENGGGWFVLIYLLCVALIGLPIMTAEIMIGRAAQRQPIVAFETLQGGRTAWRGVGWLGVLAGFIILSYYVVVAGWAMDYTLKSIVNFSQPIQEEAALKGLEFRAGAADIGVVRLDLARDAGQRNATREIARTRNTVRPSVWRAYEQYATALDRAGVVNVFHVQTIQKLWREEPRARLESWGFADDVDLEVTPADHSDYEQARARLFDRPDFEVKVIEAESLLAETEQERKDALLFDRPDFEVKVIEAESLLVEIEQERKDALLGALADYEAMPEREVRAEAEDAARRRHIRERVEAAFGAVAGDGWMSLFWTSIFMAITIVIVAGGIARGIERACLILMPALFALLLVLVVYGMFQRGFGEAVSFVFKPDATKLQPSGVLGALGQAFFSLSLGMGAMITYGSYQRSKQHLIGQSITIVGLDTAVALLACLMIFPIVFSFGQEPASGPGLVFISMPLAFAEIGTAGMFLATIFFGLLVFAALTSSISLLEVVASYFIDERGWSRPKAVWLIGGLIFLFSVPSAFAGDPDFVMTGWAASYGTDFFSTMDYLATNWMLPLGGFFIAIYAGWVMPQQLRSAELQGLAPAFFAGWLALVRFVAPAMVILILLQSIGILDADELLHGLFHG